MLKRIAYICLVFCLFLLVGSFVFQNYQSTDIVYWGQRKLTWADFQGNVPKESEYVAFSHTAISAPSTGKGDTLYCIVHTEFRKSKSWKKPEHATEYILNHEQVHFDITEYLTRCYRKQITEYTFKSVKTALGEVDSLMLTYRYKLYDLQDLYDKETDHSKNKEAQTTWDKKIDSLLQSMDAYAEPQVNVYIGYLYKR